MINELKTLERKYNAYKLIDRRLNTLITIKEDEIENAETQEEIEKLENELYELGKQESENYYEISCAEDKVFKKYISLLEEPEDIKAIKQSMVNIVKREMILTELFNRFIWKDNRIYSTC